MQEAVADATQGLGADVTIETVGGRKGATLEQSIDVTRMQGRIVILGGFRRPITLDWLPPLLKEQSIIFSSCYSILNGQHDYELAIDMLSSGKAPLKQLVTHPLLVRLCQIAISCSIVCSMSVKFAIPLMLPMLACFLILFFSCLSRKSKIASRM